MKENSKSNDLRTRTDQKIITYSDTTIDINLKLLILTIRKEIKLLLTILSIFLIFAFLYILFSEKEYSSSIVLLQEKPNNQLNLPNFLGNFNMNSFGNNNNNVIPPEVYPDVVSSTPFLSNLLSKEIKFIKYDSTFSLYHYFLNINKKSLFDYLIAYTIGLPSKIITLISGPKKYIDLPVSLSDNSSLIDSTLDNSISKTISLNRKELSAIKKISKRIDISIEDQYVIIETKMPDPLASAQLTQIVFQTLKNYIIQKNTEKAEIQYRFVLARLKESEIKFFKSQEALATFKDKNLNIISQSIEIEEQRLQSEYNLNFNLYNSLNQQVEQARIKIKEETPIFSILEPVQIPIDESEPNKIKSIIVSIIMGIFVGVLMIFIKLFYLQKTK